VAYLQKKTQVSKYLDPAVVSRLGNMDLKARLIVEGYIAGLHRSPYHGFSVEFAEYRQYMQGDNIKTIDWKVFGKTDRTYVKLFEEETNLIGTILLDKSGSMGFPTVEEARERERRERRRRRRRQASDDEREPAFRTVRCASNCSTYSRTSKMSRPARRPRSAPRCTRSPRR
jgi:uncharacterized protein (DUF58 family)